jgi:hypothetical protein
MVVHPVRAADWQPSTWIVGSGGRRWRPATVARRYGFQRWSPSSDTQEEALANLREALELYVEDSPVPEVDANPELASVDVRIPA